MMERLDRQVAGFVKAAVESTLESVLGLSGHSLWKTLCSLSKVQSVSTDLSPGLGVDSGPRLEVCDSPAVAPGSSAASV